MSTNLKGLRYAATSKYEQINTLISINMSMKSNDNGSRVK